MKTTKKNMQDVQINIKATKYARCMRRHASDLAWRPIIKGDNIGDDIVVVIGDNVEDDVQLEVADAIIHDW